MKRFLALAALCALATPAAAQQMMAPMSAPMAAPAMDPMLLTPMGFRQMAMISDSFEIESSRLALQQSRNPRVRAFANRMIQDHTMSSQALMGGMQMAAMGGMTPSLDGRHAAMLNQLAGASGPQFDSLYAQMQVMAHQEAVGLYSAQAQAGTDPNYRAFAQQTLPTLQHHYAMARRLPAAMRSGRSRG
jgi:putative membrane protein